MPVDMTFPKKLLGTNAQAAWEILAAYSNVDVESFRGHENRFYLQPKTTAPNPHFVILAQEITELGKEIYGQHLGQNGAWQHNLSPFYGAKDAPENSGVSFPEDLFYALNEEQAEKLLNSLKKLDLQETSLVTRLNDIRLFTNSQEATYAYKSMDGMPNTFVRIPLCNNTKRVIDPIHDFTKLLNYVLGHDFFTQEVTGSSAVAKIDPEHILILGTLSHSNKELIGKAFSNPREFVQYAREHLNAASYLQAKFDAAFGSWKERTGSSPKDTTDRAGFSGSCATSGSCRGS